MKKIGDIMKELGFNPQASEGTKRAFIKNLIQQQTLEPKPQGLESNKVDAKSKTPAQEQLSFNFDIPIEKTLSPKKAG